MPISRNDVGAWVVKGNPDSKWSYFDSLADDGLKPGDRRDSDWSLGPTSRNSMLEAGDLLVLYMGGAAAEVVELGRVTSETLFTDRWDPAHVLDPKEGNRDKLFFSYSGVILTTPVPRADLKANAAIADTEFIRAPQMSNPTYLTPEAVRALASMASVEDLTSAGWVDHPILAAGD